MGVRDLGKVGMMFSHFGKLFLSLYMDVATIDFPLVPRAICSLNIIGAWSASACVIGGVSGERSLDIQAKFEEEETRREESPIFPLEAP